MPKKKIEPVTILGRGIPLKGDQSNLVDVVLKDANRKGHLMCFGSTRVGKTKLIESMVRQDIRKGHSVVLVDPKSDPELFSNIVGEAYDNGRANDLCLVTPIYPELSAKIDPQSHYFMPEELVNNVVAGVKAADDYFIKIATETTSAIVQSLLLFKKHNIEGTKHINFDAIRRRCYYDGLEELKRVVDGIPGSEAEEVQIMLAQILSSPQDFFSKVSSSLRTVLTELSSGAVGKIIGKSKTNQFIQRLENDQPMILVIHTAALLTRGVASTMARVLISMIQCCVGRKLASGKKMIPPLCVYMDEFSNVAYGGQGGIAEMFNKAGGADCWLHAFTQSLADLAAEVGEEQSKKILDSTNTKIFMRINDNSTADYISEYSETKIKYQHILQTGGKILSRETEEKAVLPEHAKNLKARDFFLFTYGGSFKGRTNIAEEPTCIVKFPEIHAEYDDGHATALPAQEENPV